MPKWIHDRAMSMKKDMEKTYGPEKAEQVAFAVATQQAHRLGKSPKTFVSKETGKKERFGTPVGRAVAKAKFDKPKSEYQKTAGVLPEFLDKPRRGERLDPNSEDFAKNQAFGRAVGSGGLIGFPVGAIAGGLLGGVHGGVKGSGNVAKAVGGALGGAVLGGAGGTAAMYPSKLRQQMALLEKRRGKSKTATAANQMLPTPPPTARGASQMLPGMAAAPVGSRPAPTQPPVVKVGGASVDAFFDEVEKIAVAKPSVFGRVARFISEGKKKGFIVDKQMVRKARESHGSVSAYLNSPQGALNYRP